jgi:hypothetical protein
MDLFTNLHHFHLFTTINGKDGKPIIPSVEMGCRPSSPLRKAPVVTSASTSPLGESPNNTAVLNQNDNTAVLSQTLLRIDVQGKKQALDIPCVHSFSGADAQCIVDFLKLHGDAVNAMSLCVRQFSGPVVEIFRDLFVITLLEKIVLIGHVGNENGGNLLSALHGNKSVTTLVLSDIGFVAARGGGHLSALLLNNSHLKQLVCLRLNLRQEGARSLQSSLRINTTLQHLALHDCALGDVGTSVLVNALEHNRGLVKLCLGNNRITHNGLPSITRLLRRKSLKSIDLCCNAGLFDDYENTLHFVRALISPKCRQLRTMKLSGCRIPARAFIVIVLASMDTISQLYVYDYVQVEEGIYLGYLLKLITRMTKLQRLHINLDFTKESVLSSFHKNTSIRHLHGAVADEAVEISQGPVFSIVQRNRWIFKISLLRNHELYWNKTFGGCGRSPLFGEGLWIKVMERISTCARGDNNNDSNSKKYTGTTAINLILQEKLVVWGQQTSFVRQHNRKSMMH